jgi:transketolase
MISEANLLDLEDHAREMRHLIVNMMGFGKPHHFGGSLSCVELIAALYFYKMRYDGSNPKWEDRDRFVMSKGHSVPAQYAALAALGVIPQDVLPTLKALGSILQGHPNSWMTPGIEACTGSLGQGLSFGNGLAIASRLRKLNNRIYVLLGDGELHEGQVWEAAMTTATLGLDNLTAIIDRNTLKGQGPTEEAKRLEPLDEKWSAFGWKSIVIDGHNLKQICDALDEAETCRGKPTVLIAHTVKGKGISFIEGRFEFHNAPITEERWLQAMREVGSEVSP